MGSDGKFHYDGNNNSKQQHILNESFSELFLLHSMQELDSFAHDNISRYIPITSTRHVHFVNIERVHPCQPMMNIPTLLKQRIYVSWRYNHTN